MLFSYPSFLNKLEQDDSRLLFNSVRMALQTSLKEIWYDTTFGTNIRNLLKHGIDALIVSEIQIDIENNLMNHFANDIKVNYIDIWQELDTIKVALNYTELRTGKHNTIQTEQKFINTDTSLY